MGYCMEQHETKFRIKAENREKAFKAAKSLIGKETIEDSGGSHFSWVRSEILKEAKNLKEYMREWRWDIETEDSDEKIGDVIGIEFRGEKLGDDEMIFNAIAPYVEPDSYIQMQGEDGEIWRWVFDGKTCEEIQPKIEW